MDNLIDRIAAASPAELEAIAEEQNISTADTSQPPFDGLWPVILAQEAQSISDLGALIGLLIEPDNPAPQFGRALVLVDHDADDEAVYGVMRQALMAYLGQPISGPLAWSEQAGLRFVSFHDPTQRSGQ